MARFNACSELTRFWVETRHGCLVTESVPVKVPFGHSDIDIVVQHLAGLPIRLPDGRKAGPRLIIESKDEHDWDPKGVDFGKLLAADMQHVSVDGFVPNGTAGPIKFSMLREAHYTTASTLFGSTDFDRLFVVHAIHPTYLADLEPVLDAYRIYVLTIKDIVRDLEQWYRTHPRPAVLRHSAIGDLWHLLMGYCGAHFD